MNLNKNAFYVSTAFRKLRAFKLYLNPFCERCDIELLKAATEVHHIKEIKTHPELALEITNLESLCKPCHSSHTIKENKPNKPGKILNKLWL